MTDRGTRNPAGDPATSPPAARGDAVRAAVEGADSTILGARISATNYEPGLAARPHLGHYWSGGSLAVTLADALEKTRVPGADKGVATLIDALVSERLAGLADADLALPIWREVADSVEPSPRLRTCTKDLIRAWRGLVADGAPPPGPAVRAHTRVRHDDGFIDVTVSHPFGCPYDHECFTASFDLNRANAAMPYTA